MSLGTGTLWISGVPDAICHREVSMATLECGELLNHISHILVDQCSDRCLVTLSLCKGLMAEIGGSSVMRDIWFSSC